MIEGCVNVSGRVVTDFVPHGTWIIVLTNYVPSLMLAYLKFDIITDKSPG